MSEYPFDYPPDDFSIHEGDKPSNTMSNWKLMGICLIPIIPLIGLTVWAIWFM